MKLPQCLRKPRQTRLKPKQRSTKNPNKVIFKLSSFFPILKFKVKEKSMTPFLNPGDEVITWKYSKPKIGDVTVFKKNNKFYIKRVKKNENGKYFVLGDNEKESIDSRKFGWIDKKDIIGKVIYKI